MLSATLFVYRLYILTWQISSNIQYILIYYLTLSKYGTVLVVCVIEFSIERHFRPKVYSPLYYMFPNTAAKPLSSTPIFGWMYELLMIEEDAIIEKGGKPTVYFLLIMISPSLTPCTCI